MKAFGGVPPEIPEGAAALADTAATVGRFQPRSPRGAAFRSMLLTGWGQFYNGRPIKGGVVAAAQAASVAGILVRGRQIRRERAEPAQPGRNVFVFTTLGLVFYSAVDAYVDAHLAEDRAGIAARPAGDGGAAILLVFLFGKGRGP